MRSKTKKNRNTALRSKFSKKWRGHIVAVVYQEPSLSLGFSVFLYPFFFGAQFNSAKVLL